ncbi:hypothetical protein BOTBODRAFT_108166 [Botryobasidium botryosum FD-172 SS1]|uniref:Uncharacterized protein n=1 Tax=Botryobasidium botryosum (strain FD-172 SS1) TaxID=930990 RepID=A0A067MUU6_BOTB1|nr:hypothetical protein BOTBODRAFT_108166 [Botryobasidium botryosum FD-172 SS1]
MILRGYLLIVLSTLLLILGSYAVFFSASLPASGIRFLDEIAQDNHYKYMAALILPIGVHFVIPNWVGWQYYRNSWYVRVRSCWKTRIKWVALRPLGSLYFATTKQLQHAGKPLTRIKMALHLHPALTAHHSSLAS